jgi:hypothetical protein
MNAPLLYIGAQKEAVKEAKVAILEILKSPTADEKTKRVALKTLSNLCTTQATINNCNFMGGK